MSTETITHWKKLINTNYIGSHDLLPGQELKVIIDTVSKEMIKNAEGKDEEAVIMKIKGAKKPMILNKTNMKSITKILGTPYVEEWSGRYVVLYTAKVKAFGEVVDALRIKAEKEVTLEDIIALMAMNSKKLSESQMKDADRIINTQEVNSYGKLKKILESK